MEEEKKIGEIIEEEGDSSDCESFSIEQIPMKDDLMTSSQYGQVLSIKTREIFGDFVFLDRISRYCGLL